MLIASTCVLRNYKEPYRDSQKVGKFRTYELKQGDILDIYNPEEWKTIWGDAVYQLITKGEWVLQIGYNKEKDKAWIELHHQQGKSTSPLANIHPKNLPTKRTKCEYKRKK